MSACLDEATILAVGRGTVQGVDRVPIEEHVAECDECRSLVSAVARGSLLDLVSVLGEAASPKPPSVTVPRADAQAISERVAREVPRSGIEHAALPGEDPDGGPGDDDDAGKDEEDDDDQAITNVPPPPSTTPRVASAAPVVVEAPVPSSTSLRVAEMIPTAHPAPPPSKSAATPAPRAPRRGSTPLWVGLALMVVLAGMAADLAFRRSRAAEPPASVQPR